MEDRTRGTQRGEAERRCGRRRGSGHHRIDLFAGESVPGSTFEQRRDQNARGGTQRILSFLYAPLCGSHHGTHIRVLLGSLQSETEPILAGNARRFHLLHRRACVYDPTGSSPGDSLPRPAGYSADGSDGQVRKQLSAASTGLVAWLLRLCPGRGRRHSRRRPCSLYRCAASYWLRWHLLCDWMSDAQVQRPLHPHLVCGFHHLCAFCWKQGLVQWIQRTNSAVDC
eukprot:11965_6